jgi:N-acylneuraminate cytidylyltransferase
MKNIAIIPARGGSKRIPRKNIKPFLGKPIIAYSIETALQTGLFDEIMVSTDDEEIAEIAEKYGKITPFFRKPETSNDYATLSDVVDEVLIELKKENKIFDNFCCILATAPFLSVDDLINGYNLLIQSKFSTIRPVTKFSYPIQRSVRLIHNNEVEWFFPEYANVRSQDIETAYHDAGLFYWGRTSSGLSNSNRGAFIISELKCHDIDTEDDWILAENKYQLKYWNHKQ